MSALTQLKTQITKKTNEINIIKNKIEDIELELSELRAAYDKGKSFVEGLEQALTLIDEPSQSVKKNFEIRPGTQLHEVYLLLNNSKKPMHINDICLAMGKEPTKANKQSLTGSIGKLVREGQYFNRPEPNTFGLIEWEERQNIPPAPPPSQHFEENVYQQKKSNQEYEGR